MSRPENDLPFVDVKAKYPGVFFGTDPKNAMYCNSPDSMGGFSNPANEQCHSLRTDYPSDMAELPENHRLAKNSDSVDREWMHELFDFK